MRYKDRNFCVKRCQLQDGIDLCKRNVSDFLNETETLISRGRPSHALIFAEFAIEELGKILVIKHAFNLDPNDPFKIMGKEFYDHETKSKNAWTILDPKLKILFDEGVCLPNTVFERGVAVEYVLADHEGRLRTAFVDYWSEQWLLERNVKQDYLKALVAEIRTKLAQQ